MTGNMGGIVIRADAGIIQDDMVLCDSIDSPLMSGNGQGVIVPLSVYRECVSEYPLCGVMLSMKATGVSNIFSSGEGDILLNAPVVAIQGIRFNDGRVFSFARTLSVMGYNGVIRLYPPCIPDQVMHAFSCGFHEICLSDEILSKKSLQQWMKVLADGMSAGHYQASFYYNSIVALRNRSE